jgi:hypothetical protein
MLRNLPAMETKQRPIINSQFISNPTWGEPRSMNLDTLISWIKRTPECIGVVKRIATDIVTDMDFMAIEPKAPLVGRPPKTRKASAEDKATVFWKKNLGKQTIMAAVIDWLISGDAYLWMGKLSESQIKEIVRKKFLEYGFELKGEVDLSELKQEALTLDEDFNAVNSMQIVPSSMVTIDHDDYKVKSYIQKSKKNLSELRKFSTDEIIHAKFLEIDGRVYGFSPMESDFIAIKTVNAVQDYNYNYFANGVKLDRAWLFTGNPNQTLIDKTEENLKKYKMTTYAHGDLLVTGADKISVEKLNEVGEEMEFRKVAINAVGRIAFSFNMPANILSPILGGDIKSGGMGSDIEDTGYYSNIEEAKQYWEFLLNSQLFGPEFGVEARFKRKFRQDQIRQMQYLTQAQSHLDWIFMHKVPVSDEYVLDKLQIDRKYLIEGKIDKEGMMAQAAGLPMPKGPNQQKYSDSKKTSQKPQANNQSQTGS